MKKIDMNIPYECQTTSLIFVLENVIYKRNIHLSYNNNIYTYNIQYYKNR